MWASIAIYGSWLCWSIDRCCVFFVASFPPGNCRRKYWEHDACNGRTRARQSHSPYYYIPKNLRSIIETQLYWSISKMVILNWAIVMVRYRQIFDIFSSSKFLTLNTSYEINSRMINLRLLLLHHSQHRSHHRTEWYTLKAICCIQRIRCCHKRYLMTLKKYKHKLI